MSTTMAKALRVELELPDDAFGEDFDQETFCAKVREAAVMRLLREHRISQGKAAELLGLSRDQCLGLMASHGVPVVDLSPEELELELRQAEAVFRRPAQVIVSDAGPIIAFARANLLDLLGRVVVELGIPDAVHAELTVGGSARVEDVIQAEWIKRVSIPIGSEAEIMPRRLGKGEREAIVLAQSLGLPLLADDAAARREALSRRLVVVGSLGVLREAKLLGIIEGVREPLDRLRETGFWISQDLYERFLRAVG